MNKIYGLNLDALRLCYEAKEPTIIDFLAGMQPEETADFYDFYLRRIEGKHFENVYQIRYDELGEDHLFGELKFGIKSSDETANTHGNGNRKAWISIDNRILYSDELHYLEYFTSCLHLEFHNITAMDIALDMSMNIARAIKRLIRNPNITTILNGKRITDRKQDRPEIIYTMTGNMDRDKYLTVNIKQKKAIKDKSKGITLIAYDKQGEIANGSGKGYIADFYGNPKKIYRLEVHLNNEELKDYVKQAQKDTYLEDLIFNEHSQWLLFCYALRSLIRFQIDGKPLSWDDVLEGVITTLPAKRGKQEPIPLKQAC